MRASTGVQNLVLANDCRVRIRKESKTEPPFPTMPARHLGRINADGRQSDAARIKFRKPILKTPQLGVAERSPVAAVKN